jgi:3-methyladenine DNA glycosylase/8-oxoguanine DNA glycosylase
MEFIYDVPQPFGLEATLKSHGWFQLVPFYWDKNLKVLNWATKLPGQNPTVIQVSEKLSGRSRIRFSCSGSIKKKIVLAKFRHVFNLDLDLSGFYSICKNNSRLRGVVARGMGRLMRSETLFEDLFKSICGTNVKWSQAVKMINRIAVLGEEVPGTDFRIFPTPDRILSAGESFIRETGRAGYRSGYLVELAARFVEGEPLAVSVEGGEMERS